MQYRPFFARCLCINSDNLPSHCSFSLYNLRLWLTISNREPHASIHKLNLSRLPLCLPPHTDRPTLYVLGLSQYAELFFGIEDVWVSLIGDPGEWIDQDADAAEEAEISSLEEDSPSTLAPTNEQARIKTILRMLYIPELLRTRALKDDLRFLRASSPPTNPAMNEPLQTRDYGRHIAQDIIRRIQAKPHILLAYVWILYSALLYGGRDIRTVLLRAGPEFWGLSGAELTSPRRIPCPLSFWHVDEEGEVKVKLRARMVDAERCLSVREQQDILDEAGRIFGKLEFLTGRLDEDARLVDARVRIGDFGYMIR